jgi:hypothetical protein
MKTYAVLNSSSIVENLIVASSLEMAETVTGANCVHVALGLQANIGDIYSDGSFSTPA